jgi:prophage maintenance system killer protein
LPSGKRHYRLTLADALSAHERALQTGGLSGIPNIGMVESAIARPYNGHYQPIARKAAALLQSISTNHGFADGNKRTAIIHDVWLADEGVTIRYEITAEKRLVSEYKTISHDEVLKIAKKIGDHDAAFLKLQKEITAALVASPKTRHLAFPPWGHYDLDH